MVLRSSGRAISEACGIDGLQAICNTIIYYHPSVSYKEQAEGRLKRAGQAFEQVFVYTLQEVLVDSEHTITNVMDVRTEVLQNITEEKRGKRECENGDDKTLKRAKTSVELTSSSSCSSDNVNDWDCGTCTFRNEPKEYSCLMCSTPKIPTAIGVVNSMVVEMK